MSDTFWVDSNDRIMVDSSDRPIDCPVCPCHISPCSSGAIPSDLRLTIRYMLHGSHPRYLQAVVLSYDATACVGSTPGWSYDGGDIEICSGFSLRALSLCCISSAWNLELVVVNNGIQDDLQNPSALTDPVTTDSPLHITSVSQGEYSTPCGSGYIYIDIEEVEAISPCCGSDSLPSTATATFTIDSLPPQTLNLVLSGNTYIGSSTCNVGDGHTQVRFAYIANCEAVFGDPRSSLVVSKIVDGATVSSITWTYGGPAGSISANYEVTCDPHTVHMEGLNTDGDTGGGTSQTCGGVTYPFATAGNVYLVLDVVTP